MNAFVTLLLLLLQPTQPAVPAWQTDPTVPISYVGVPPGYVSRTPVTPQPIQPIYYEQVAPAPQVVYTSPQQTQPIQQQPSWQPSQGPILTTDGSPIRQIIRIHPPCKQQQRGAPCQPQRHISASCHGQQVSPK